MADHDIHSLAAIENRDIFRQIRVQIHGAVQNAARRRPIRLAATSTFRFVEPC